MATTKAVVLVAKGKAEVRDLPMPKVSQGQMLVKVKAVGLNPTDWKSIDQVDEKRFGSRCGCDYAGEVVEAGAGIAFKKGDRVSGVLFGANPNTPGSGAFSEHTLAGGNIALKIPGNVTDEEAATFGVSVLTVGQGFYEKLQLPLPDKPAATPFPVLIYGGSTATGIYAIKYAKLSGLTVIATSSPHNFELLKSLGADHVFNYKEPGVGAKIRALTNNKLKYAWDCTGYGGQICSEALSDNVEGGKPKYGTIIPIPREQVEKINPVIDGPHFTLGYKVMDSDTTGFPDFFKPDPVGTEFAKKFWQLTQGLLESGKLKPLRPEVNRLGRGLEGVIKGLDELRNDRVSGTKLVYTI
ncbi:GroES-like protein [Xylaria nigripes]|nr:GroES-like protein [Xylaria nigripes]